MKILLPILLLVTVASSLMAQENRVFKAKKAFNNGRLSKAKKAIDIANLSPETIGDSEAWLYRGNIYYAIYISTKPRHSSLTDNPALESYLALKKYKELVPIDSISAATDSILINIGRLSIADGADWFKEKYFERSFESFLLSANCAKLFEKVDTTALFNCAIASGQTKEVDRTVEWYDKCINVGYRESACCSYIIQTLSSAGRDSEAGERLSECHKKHPNDLDLLIAQINRNIEKGEIKRAETNLKKALKIDSRNEFLLLTIGAIKDNIGQQDKAEIYYLEALKVNPDLFDANYNMGVLYFNRGADVNNEAIKISDNKKYLTSKKEANRLFAMALPYLEKAEKLEPNDKSTLQSLKSLYIAMKDADNVIRINKLLE